MREFKMFDNISHILSEVAGYRVAGASYGKIASNLNISEKTVRDLMHEHSISAYELYSLGLYTELCQLCKTKNRTIGEIAVSLSLTKNGVKNVMHAIKNLSTTEKKILEKVFDSISKLNIENSGIIIDTILADFNTSTKRFS